jgi:aminoglycoside phosphotransferase (APT) family kinase protein
MEPITRAIEIARSLGIPVAEAFELAGGHQNHVIRIVGDEHDTVVRFARDVDQDGDPFDAEAWCLLAAAEVGVPTSTLLARGRFDDTSYLVTEFVPGESAAPDDLVAWRAIGRCAAALASVDVTDAPGALFSRFGRDPMGAWRAHLVYNRAALSADDRVMRLGVYPAAHRGRLRRMLASLGRRRLAQGLIHGDLSTRNVVVGETASVIDWGAAQVGPAPWGDLARIHRWRILDDPDSPVSEDAWGAVLEGAGIDPVAARRILDELTVLYALDVVRWAIDRRPDRLMELIDESMRLIRSTLD